MQISEFSFPHLHAAHDERLVIELERRRVAAERRAEAGTEGSPVRAGSRAIRSGGRVDRSERPSSDAAGERAVPDLPVIRAPEPLRSEM